MNPLNGDIVGNLFRQTARPLLLEHSIDMEVASKSALRLNCLIETEIHNRQSNLQNGPDAIDLSSHLRFIQKKIEVVVSLLLSKSLPFIELVFKPTLCC